MEPIALETSPGLLKKKILQKAFDRVEAEKEACSHQTFNDHANFQEHNSHSAHVSAPVFQNF